MNEAEKELRQIRMLLLRTFGPPGDSLTNVQMIEQLAEDHRQMYRLTHPSVNRFCCSGDLPRG
jgi:hypothetical protein